MDEGKTEMTLPNYRFWVMTNGGPVKLTLRPGEGLYWESHGQSADGWWAEYHNWWHSGREGVREHWKSDGCDCDGRLKVSGESTCRPEDLRHIPARPVGDDWTDDEWRTYQEVTKYHPSFTTGLIHWPLWQDTGHEIYDETAQAMGY